MSRSEIPAWIRSFAHPAYTNAFEFLPADCPRLYPTETLFGNWDSTVLLLAKDAAPADTMSARFETEGVAGWRHSYEQGEIGTRTNERLNGLVARYQLPIPLYGSAAANMLKHGGTSAALPGLRRGLLHDYLAEVLRWVVGEMPNLKAVACLGEDASRLVLSVLGDGKRGAQWKRYRDGETAFQGQIASRTIMATCHFHPARVSNERMSVGWKGLASISRLAEDGQAVAPGE